MKMIKSMKRMSLMMVVAVMALMIFGGGSAFAYTSKSTPVSMNIEGSSCAGTGYIHTSENASSVFSTFEVPYDCLVYVKHELWARYAGGSWSVISTKYGGKASNSFGSKVNSNVEFTNIGNYGREMRVRVILYNYSNYTGLLQTDYSYTWWR